MTEGMKDDEIRDAIDRLNFSNVKKKICDKRSGLGWSQEKTDQVESDYKNMLFLWRKYPGESLPPSKCVDEFWHAHILDTRKYMDDCQMIFGHYRHHNPYFGFGTPDGDEILNRAFERTQQLFFESTGDYLYEYEDEDADDDRQPNSAGSDRSTAQADQTLQR